MYRNTNSPIISPYRILDLTEGGCMIGGRILADLGADVIKIEPPAGSLSRIAPFYHDKPDPEKSLYWFAYNLNKRGITLDISRNEGREIFKKLASTADVVIESFEHGVMQQYGLGYEDLVKTQPDIILTSIAFFGQSGPKAKFKGSDLTTWASGGFLFICGEPDRAPTWIGFPQASLHAGSEAATGTMTALWHRLNTGEGQQVGVSMQECVVACTFNTPEMWDLNRVEFKRFSQGMNIGTGGVRTTHVYQCKDGYVLMVMQGGVEPFVSSLRALITWMAEDGMAEDWLKEMDWAADYDASKLTQEKVDRVEAAVARFLLTRTKQDLYDNGALKRRILLAPMGTAKDLCENEQLKARDFWMQVEHPELGDTLQYPGSFVKVDGKGMTTGYRAPLLGEHNAEIYREIGLSADGLDSLKQSGVV
ncbi:CaiB/BaiF CoA transferase family protein [Chloroflexota bacterium]